MKTKKKLKSKQKLQQKKEFLKQYNFDLQTWSVDCISFRAIMKNINSLRNETISSLSYTSTDQEKANLETLRKKWQSLANKTAIEHYQYVADVLLLCCKGDIQWYLSHYLTFINDGSLAKTTHLSKLVFADGFYILSDYKVIKNEVILHKHNRFIGNYNREEDAQKALYKEKQLGEQYVLQLTLRGLPLPKDIVLLLVSYVLPVN